jgi:hypothetical protein
MLLTSMAARPLMVSARGFQPVLSTTYLFSTYCFRLSLYRVLHREEQQQGQSIHQTGHNKEVPVGLARPTFCGSAMNRVHRLDAASIRTAGPAVGLHTVGWSKPCHRPVHH